MPCPSEKWCAKDDASERHGRVDRRVIAGLRPRPSDRLSHQKQRIVSEEAAPGGTEVNWPFPRIVVAGSGLRYGKWYLPELKP